MLIRPNLSPLANIHALPHRHSNSLSHMLKSPPPRRNHWQIASRQATSSTKPWFDADSAIIPNLAKAQALKAWCQPPILRSSRQSGERPKNAMNNLWRAIPFEDGMVRAGTSPVGKLWTTGSTAPASARTIDADLSNSVSAAKAQKSGSKNNAAVARIRTLFSAIAAQRADSIRWAKSAAWKYEYCP